MGFTKVFMKEEMRNALERVLNEAILAQVVRIQS